MAYYLRSVEELDALPDQAVVYDHSNQVWQKLTMSRAGSAWYLPGSEWYLPGSELPHAADAVALPARLLDDGL